MQPLQGSEVDGRIIILPTVLALSNSPALRSLNVQQIALLPFPTRQGLALLPA